MMAPSLVVGADGDVALARRQRRVASGSAPPSLQVIAGVDRPAAAPLADAVEAPAAALGRRRSSRSSRAGPTPPSPRSGARWPVNRVAAARPVLRRACTPSRPGATRPGDPRRGGAAVRRDCLPRRRPNGLCSGGYAGSHARTWRGAAPWHCSAARRTKPTQVIDLREPEPAEAAVGLAGAVPGVQWARLPGPHRPVPGDHVPALHRVLRTKYEVTKAELGIDDSRRRLHPLTRPSP